MPKKIPAIKFKIAADISDKYKNQLTLTKEINRCQPNIDKKAIKFVSIKDNLIIIATDDQKTHDQLNSKWPEDAFTTGIRMLAKKDHIKRPKIVIIKGVHVDLDINDAEVLQQLKEQGLVNPTRIIGKNKLPTTLIKAEAIDEPSYRAALANKILIGYIKCKIEPLRTVLQCFKCQKVGHTHFNCKNETVCLKCSRNHSVKECDINNKTKCSNCGGDHVACARKCPFLKEAVKIKPVPNVKIIQPAKPLNKTFAQIVKGEQKSNQTTDNQLPFNLESKLKEIISKKIGELINKKLLPTLLESILNKLTASPKAACLTSSNLLYNFLNSPDKRHHFDRDSVPPTPQHRDEQAKEANTRKQHLNNGINRHNYE